MFKVIALPTKSLRQASDEVDAVYLLKPETQNFMDELIKTMYDDDGIGIAAPQVARNVRVCVIGKDAIPPDCAYHGSDLILANPRWEKISKKTLIQQEGCLSVPGLIGKVKRCKDIKVSALDKKGKEISFEARGFFARVVQHEVDHLNGILFIDKATDIRRVESKKPINPEVISQYLPD